MVRTGNNRDRQTVQKEEDTMNENTNTLPDQGAIMRDDRPAREIFETGMAQGLFDTCENPNQVNKMIAEMQGKAICTFFVNGRSHGWKYENGKWIAPTPEWLAANPFVPGQRLGSAAARKGLLSDSEIAGIKAQVRALELVPAEGKDAVQPIIDGLYDQLAAHRKAVELAAMTREFAKNRTAAKQSLEYALRILDGTGVAWRSDFIAWVQEILSGYSIDQSRINTALLPMADTE